MPILKPLFPIYQVRFAQPSVVNDTPEAWAKLERDYVKFLRELREAVCCFEAARVEQDVHNIVKGRPGNTPKKQRNAHLLAEYDARAAKGPVNKSKLAREYRKKHGLRIKDDSLRKQLDRLLEARDEIREKAEQEPKLRWPSLIWNGTNKSD